MTSKPDLRSRYNQLTVALDTIRNVRCAAVVREVLIERYAQAAAALAHHGLGGLA